MFDGRICVVTGGAKGIGREIVREFAHRRANVAFIDIDKEQGKQLAAEIKQNYGVDAFFFHGDIGSEEDAELFAAAVIGQYDKIDYLVNNGRISFNRNKEGRIGGFEEGIKLGVTAPYRMTRLFQDYFYMGGCVVNIAAAGEAESKEDKECSAAACGALIALTHVQAESLQGRVRVNCVSPSNCSDCDGDCDRQVGEPFDITKTVMFLCEGKADFINGKNLKVDGGMTKMMMYHGESGWSFQ